VPANTNTRLRTLSALDTPSLSKHMLCSGQQTLADKVQQYRYTTIQYSGWLTLLSLCTCGHCLQQGSPCGETYSTPVSVSVSSGPTSTSGSAETSGSGHTSTSGSGSAETSSSGSAEYSAPPRREKRSLCDLLQPDSPVTQVHLDNLTKACLDIQAAYAQSHLLLNNGRTVGVQLDNCIAASFLDLVSWTICVALTTTANFRTYVSAKYMSTTG
jgi:hypothetical protein